MLLLVEGKTAWAVLWMKYDIHMAQFQSHQRASVALGSTILSYTYGEISFPLKIPRKETLKLLFLNFEVKLT